MSADSPIEGFIARWSAAGGGERANYQLFIGVLKQLHDELDAAVCDAYGWRDAPDDDAILERLVALNAERVREEAQGRVRWLRP